jgi:uncharacterized protein
MHATITALNVYPVKSCRGVGLDSVTLAPTGFDGDRHWMVVSDSGRWLTQRELPRLALVVPALNGVALTLEAPGMSPLRLSRDYEGAALQVTVIWDRITAIDAGDAAAAWFTEFLGRPVRLVRFDPSLSRALHPNVWQGDPGEHIEFADGFPLLVLSEASLEDLSARVGAPLAMNRFRPNVVLAGLQPYDEDRIHELGAGNVRLRMVRPCTRCKITTIDQHKGEVIGPEPLATLRSYRWSADLRGVMFGQYAIVAGGVDSRLRIGQQLEIAWV